MITEQEITIYNKFVDDKKQTTWHRTPLIGTYRNTSILNRTKTGSNTNDTALLRIFDTSKYVNEEEYKKELKPDVWTVQIGDIVVDKDVDFDITSTAPITELQKQFGKAHVQAIVSIDDNRKGTVLDHIKVGLK